ncbi:MAG: amino acid ABC transporter substrate-binding protein [Kiritimatiellae bacterium]|nr:amino acid ABC transporter substrate-binding protein [Kiritimatiellia bacterium]
MRLSILLALAALAGCSDRSGRQAADPRISDPSRPLVFLTHPTEPPCSYTNEVGKFAGTDVDLARRIAAKMGRELVVEPVTFSEILPRLRAGTADFGIATISITEARHRDVDFSAPYAFGGACFLYRTGDPKPRMSQIARLLVGVEADTIEDLYLCFHGGDPKRFNHLGEAVAALENKDIDAVICDESPLKKIAGESQGRFSLTSLVTRDGYGVAVDKRRPDVLAAANAVIAEGGAK